MILLNTKLLKTLFLCLITLPLFSCGGAEEPYTKQTFHVKGKIAIDGKEPGSSVKVSCHNKGEVDTKHPTISGCKTADDGTFEIATYTSGDEMPEGEYVLTFLWGKYNAISRSYGGTDKLKKRYSDPKKSEIIFTVEAGKPTDLGVIELTTK